MLSAGWTVIVDTRRAKEAMEERRRNHSFSANPGRNRARGFLKRDDQCWKRVNIEADVPLHVSPPEVLCADRY